MISPEITDTLAFINFIVTTQRLSIRQHEMLLLYTNTFMHLNYFKSTDFKNIYKTDTKEPRRYSFENCIRYYGFRNVSKYNLPKCYLKSAVALSHY